MIFVGQKKLESRIVCTNAFLSEKNIYDDLKY